MPLPRPMRYEHLIEIHNARVPLAPPFARDALWRGLLVRVYEPEAFPVGPDGCEWEEAGADARGLAVVRRTVHFGALAIRDRVTLEPMHSLVFEAEPRPDMAALRLTLTIEEPAEGVLALRFVYESEVEVSPAEAPYEALRHQAWLENDRDMVRTLRHWLAQGRLASA